MITESFDGKLLVDYVEELFKSGRVEACLCGWIEVMGDNCSALVVLVEYNQPEESDAAGGSKPLLFTAENLNFIMQHN